MSRSDQLERAIEKVVSGGNCSGCGACSLISSRVSLSLAADGQLRPQVSSAQTGQDPSQAAAEFRSVCPGRIVVQPRGHGRQHRIFGNFISAWEGYAADPDVRYAGSSAGVLTALTDWFIQNGLASAATAAAESTEKPTRTVPVRITTREEAIRASGSRYAPVSPLSSYRPDSGDVFIGKPCEASALNQLHDVRGTQSGSGPILSFFCAGSPSQNSTDSLARHLGLEPAEITDLQYRGRGWPGFFTARDRSGKSVAMPYEESWGRHLGRDLPWRCKLCVDGTGSAADISVGDFWNADAQGRAVFSEAAGNSVVIARTPRGHDWLMKARAQGVVVLREADLDAVARVQPHQTERKVTLLYRLAARMLAGRHVPRYKGYRLWQSATFNPRRIAKAFLGTFERTISASSRRFPES